jgi:hypothetical protein
LNPNCNPEMQGPARAGERGPKHAKVALFHYRGSASFLPSPRSMRELSNQPTARMRRERFRDTHILIQFDCCRSASIRPKPAQLAPRRGFSGATRHAASGRDSGSISGRSTSRPRGRTRSWSRGSTRRATSPKGRPGNADAMGPNRRAQERERAETPSPMRRETHCWPSYRLAENVISADGRA